MSLRSALVIACCALIPLIHSSHLGAEDESARDKARAELKQNAQEIRKLSHAFNLVHEIVAPSVVSIHTKEQVRLSNPFSGRSVTREVEIGEGSGFIFFADDKFSYIISNSHVVLQTNHDQQFVQGRNGQPVGYDRIRVALNDNREIDAEYVGVYLQSDIAVLKIPIPHLPAIEWGDSDQAKVGDWVVALGYPLGVGYSATSGIVSATDRSTGIYESIGGFDSFIQTDAAINPGNSGGPLVNIEGQVIGINASIISKTGVNIGLGFAIPSNLVRRISEEILAHGSFKRPMVGVQLQDLSADESKALGLPAMPAVRVGGIIPDSPAASAGLQKGDIVLTVGGNKIMSMQQFQARIASSKRGEPVQLKIWRGGSERAQQITPIGEDELEKRLAGAAETSAGHRGFDLAAFGMTLGTDAESGLVVTAVDAGGLAEQAGLAAGDRVLHEKSLGALRSIDDAKTLGKRKEIVIQVYKDERSFWLRLRR